MDGQFDPAKTIGDNVAGLIRSVNSGMCSGYPAGVSYPGVPSVDDVIGQLGARPDDAMTEDQWFGACGILDD